MAFEVCQICNVNKTRKVYQEYGGVRCCQSCLKQQTISDYRLRTEFNVPQQLLDSLQSVEKTLWAQRVGSYTLQFYWIPHILPIIFDIWGVMTLEEVPAIKHDQQVAAAAESDRKRTKRNELVKQLAKANQITMKDLRTSGVYEKLMSAIDEPTFESVENKCTYIKNASWLHQFKREHRNDLNDFYRFSNDNSTLINNLEAVDYISEVTARFAAVNAANDANAANASIN